MPSLILYFAPGSCAFASLIALAEAGQRFEARKVKLADREQDSAWFRALNPLGRVPSSLLICRLTADGVRKTRSLAFSIVPALTTSTKLLSSSVGRLGDMAD